MIILFLILAFAPPQSSLADANQRGQTALKQQRYAEAVRAFDEALSLAPANNAVVLAGLHYYKAAALAGSGDLLAAIANVEHAIRYVPKEPAYLQLRARLEEQASKQVIPADQIRRALTAARSFAAEGSAEASIDLWVNYDFDSEVLSGKGQAQADALAEVMRSGPFSKSVFLLIGHTDAQGTDEYNMALSQRRATRLKQYLVDKYHIPDGQIQKEGHGERELKMTGNSEADHAINRRVEIRLVP
jgi:outer membrane protein OmpA-like peptidoglycan-associated protein